MRRFVLQREKDVTGVSGTGTVADGVCFPDGSAVIKWRGAQSSTVLWHNMDDAIAVHGHGGLTAFVWIDKPEQMDLFID